MYNKTVMDHFRNPRNVGVIEDANGVGVISWIGRLHISQQQQDGSLMEMEADYAVMWFSSGALGA